MIFILLMIYLHKIYLSPLNYLFVIISMLIIYKLIILYIYIYIKKNQVSMGLEPTIIGSKVLRLIQLGYETL